MTMEKLKAGGKRLLEKLKADKRAVILLAVGLALLLVLCLSDRHSSKNPKNDVAQPSVTTEQQSDETRLRALLSSIRGAGSAEVMITYSEQTQFVYAAAQDSETESGQNGQVRNKEKRDPVILKGGETQTGLVERTLSPKVQGVAVVCEGASDPTVRSQIVSAVSALFGLGINHISVAEMASQEEPS